MSAVTSFMTAIENKGIINLHWEFMSASEVQKTGKLTTVAGCN